METLNQRVLTMEPLEIVKFAVSALSDRKLRSVLTVLMVAVGVGLITALNGMSAGMNVYMENQLATFGANVLTVGPPSRFERTGAVTTGITLTDQIGATLKNIQGVKEVVPYIRGSVTLVSGSIRTRASVTGIDQTKFPVLYPSVSASAGGLLAQHDGSGIVLGSAVAQPSGETQPFAKYGQTLVVQYTVLQTVGGVQKSKVQKRTLQVKGILDNLGNPQVDNGVLVSVSSATILFQRTDYSGFYVVTNSPETNDSVQKAIERIYGTTIGITSPGATAQRVQEMRASFTNFLLSIGSVSLIVGAVGIVTTLYTSVTERIREIGTLKALGFSGPLILVLFVAESLLIGIMGGFAGLLVGVGGAGFLQGLMPGIGGRLGVIFLPGDIIFALELAVLLSAVAGLYPAWRASRLDPVVALRKE